jgi:hypothetical protein
LTEDQLIVRRCAYWQSFMGQPATKNKETIRVAVPRKNVFSVDALNQLATLIRAGEPLC